MHGEDATLTLAGAPAITKSDPKGGAATMVRLKLRRHGKKKQPTYRLVAADSHSPRDGRFIEILGHYNPRTDPPTLVLKEEKIFEWLKKGAQPTEAVRQILTTAGVLRRAEEAPPSKNNASKTKTAEAAPAEPAPVPSPVPEAAAAVSE
jgi:small subunit ribosomal protein S16